jgi:hypothetical protein
VRFYFTDAEAKALMNASGCGACTTISDPYVSGVTQYSDMGAGNEDGDFNNDIGGFLQFKLPANVEIIPYDTGYYAEFPVNSFSEFWINNGGTTGTAPLPISLLSFDAIKQTKSVLLQWTTENEVNAASFIVERSNNGITYNSIGTVTANNTSGTNHYSLPDDQPFAGISYYRLKSIDKNSIFKYSQAVKINFATAADGIVLYPNPVTNGTLTITTAVNCYSAQLFDAAGRLIRVFQLKERNNNLSLQGISKGIYQLKIAADNKTYTEKIIIE